MDSRADLIKALDTCKEQIKNLEAKIKNLEAKIAELENMCGVKIPNCDLDGSTTDLKSGGVGSIPTAY